ncbi:MAG TPA: hypothetical protein VEW04_01250 [Allosphingosinicella sp.]|nr:hypothetical protein [Allosphingosinicella sp.]
MEENPIRAHGDPPDTSAAEPASPANLPALADPPADFEPVHLRYRRDGWTPATQRAFLEHLADTLSLQRAAELVDMSMQSVNALRRRSATFDHACNAALIRGVGERGRAQLVDQAVNGRLVRRFYHGELIAEDRVFSDRLLLAVIERGEKILGAAADRSGEFAANWESAMDRLESGALEGGYRVWRDRYGYWNTNNPPPPGFEEYQGEPTDPDFERRLSEAEENALAGQQKGRLETGVAARDLYFGFKPRARAIDREPRLKH